MTDTLQSRLRSGAATHVDLDAVADRIDALEARITAAIAVATSLVGKGAADDLESVHWKEVAALRDFLIED